MIYRTDYHVHSKFSDGKNEPAEYIEPAISAGLKELGFSEHLNLLIPEQQWCMNPSRTTEYLNHLKNLRRSTKDIVIRTGLEVDFFPGKEQEIFDFIAPLDLDYVIGSVHYMGETTVDSGQEFYTGKDIDAIWKSYFNLLYQAVESGLFDLIGHADLVRIFNFNPSGDPLILYKELAKKMSKHDVAFEVNTNGRNRPLGDFYPDRRYLNLFSMENVPVCVNSDSHFPARVGQYFDEAYLLLRDAGFTEMCTFNKRERVMVPADFTELKVQ
jgi:histidinol-phosphatase (PHP family)